MKIKKRWFVVPLLVIIAVVAVLFALRKPIAVRLVKHHVHDQLAHTWFEQLPDSLNVVLCGAGGPMPDPERSGPCSVVIAGPHVFVVDVGPGSVRNIVLAGVPVGKVEGVLLTHYHSDHIGALGELMLQRWINGSQQQPLPVYGPPGVQQVVAGFDLAYKLDDGYRSAHHGPAVAPPSGAGGIARPFPAPAVGQGHVVLDEGDLKITAFKVNHDPAKPAVGYRFDYKGRSIVFSGDTRPTSNLVHFAKGADVLVSEGQSAQLLAIVRQQAKAVGRDNIAQITHDILSYHTSPAKAAAEAARAGVGYLLFNHVTPPLPLPALRSIYLEGVDNIFKGEVQIGRDGTWLSLPVASNRIEVGNRR